MVNCARVIPFALILLAGCVKIPDDEACCMLEQAPTVDIAVKAALETGAVVDGEYPPECWWEIFGDETLNSLVCRALSHSPDLKATEARVTMAFEEATVARSRLFPSIGLNAGVNWRYLGKNDFFRAYAPTIPGNVPEYLLNLDFQYEFDFWGKNSSLYRARIGDARAKAAEYDAAKLILTTSVSSVYVQHVALIEKLRLLQSERENIKQLVELSRKRKENMLDNEQQVLNSNDQLEIMEQNILLTQEQVALAEHLLKRLVGLGPDAHLHIEPSSKKSLPTIHVPRHLSSDLLARRPDLMARIWLVESAAYRVGAARTEFYPRIDLCALGGLDSVFFSKLFTTGSLSSNIYPALHLPIFTAGRIKANLRAYEAEFHASIYDYNQTLLLAVQEVADKVVSLQKADEDLKIEARLVQNRIENQQLARLRFSNSLDSLDAVLYAQNQAIEEQITQIGMEYEKRLATIQLIRALGGGYCTEEIPYE